MSPSKTPGVAIVVRRLLAWLPEVVLTAFSRRVRPVARWEAIASLLLTTAVSILLVAIGRLVLEPQAIAFDIASGGKGIVAAVNQPPPSVRRPRIQGLLQSRDVARGDASSKRVETAELRSLLQLRGILGGDPPRALVWHRATDMIHYLSEGDKLDEFEVVKIGDNSITLKFMGQEFDLPL